MPRAANGNAVIIEQVNGTPSLSVFDLGQLLRGESGRQTLEQLVGDLQLRDLPVTLGKQAQQPEPGEITGLSANVIEFAKTVRGKSVFILDNGQVWRQLDADITQVRDPSPDERFKVRIETGAMGSYDLMIEGRNGIIKVTRLK